jgi:hypothetical protein
MSSAAAAGGSERRSTDALKATSPDLNVPVLRCLPGRMGERQYLTVSHTLSAVDLIRAGRRSNRAGLGHQSVSHRRDRQPIAVTMRPDVLLCSTQLLG